METESRVWGYSSVLKNLPSITKAQSQAPPIKDKRMGWCPGARMKRGRYLMEAREGGTQTEDKLE